MTNTFLIKQNDTSPAIEYVLSPASVILTGATVVFNMRKKGNTKISRGSASITTATVTPTVQYDWAGGDTDEVGVFQAEFEVTYADTSVETFPNEGFITISVEDDIA